MKMTFPSRQPWCYRLVGAILVPLQLFVSMPLPLPAATNSSANQPVVVSPPPKVKVKHSVRDASIFKPVLSLPSNPTDIDIRMARIFSVPLIPTSGQSSNGENQALASALRSFHKRTDTENVSALTNFLTQYPQSRWRAALQYNLGVLHYETGYLTAALDEWRDTWNLTKGVSSGELHALADGAFGRLSILSAQLGRTEDLKNLFAEAKGRGFYGAAEQQVRSAQSGYRTMQQHPDIAFKCGPFALDSIRTPDKNVHRRSAVVQTAASTAKGTSLSMVKNWSDQLNLNYQMAKRAPGASIIVPSVMHWKLGHFGALVRFKKGKYLIQDPTFAGQELWVSAKALEQETSGYFLVPQGPLPTGWTAVSQDEAAQVWGRGGAQNQNMNANSLADVKCPICPTTTPMASPSIFAMLASLSLQDTPVRYQVPVGPDPDLMVTYNYDFSAPPVFSYSNFGYDWSFQYISFVTVDGSQNVTVTLPGGGAEIANYSAFDDVNNVYPPDITSHAQIYLDAPGVYDRHLPDGSRQVYSQPDGTGRIFLKQIFDPQGNSLILNYDTNFRLSSIVDQLSQATTFSYLSNTPGNVGFYKIITITDPFGIGLGRHASFQYDSATSLELVQITDVLGITSQFTYDTNYFIDSLTTPYGKTLFNHYIPTSDADGESGLRITWPDGTQSVTENYIGHELNTYYWDRKASPAYPNKSSASVTNWLLDANSRTESGVPNYTRQSLEGGSVTWPYAGTPPGAVQYRYPAGYAVPPTNPPPTDPELNFTHNYTGTSNLPIQISRALDNGHTQLYQYNYNSIGKVTQAIDPLNRTFTYYYDGNNIDLLQVRQTQGTNNDLLARYVYNSQHEPLTYEDGSGQTTTYTYTIPLGQIQTIVQPSPGGTTTFNYNSSHYLTSIDGPLAGSNDVTTFTYDGFGRIYTVADSEGYTLTFAYDNYDRPTTVTYPDGTYEQVTWNLLDPVFLRDRLGNWTQQQFNSLRQLAAVTDPLGRTTKYQWCTCGALGSLTDAAGHVTSWLRDLQGRPMTKTYPDTSTETYTYEPSTSRLSTVKDALNQIKTYSYYDDNMLSGIAYTSAVHSTSNVSCYYDLNYPRLTSVGTYAYSYNAYITDPFGSATTGAGRVSQITNSALGSSAVTYAYDALGRVTSRLINSTANASTWSYDAMSRVTSIVNPLGTFTPAYVDQGFSGGDKGTRRLVSFTYPNGQVTNYSYFSTTNDERLQDISNLNSSSAVISKFDYTYDAKGQIATWKRQADSNPVTRYDTAYDAAGQLASAVLKTDSTNAILHQYYYNFDTAGNRTSEQVDTNVTQAIPTSNGLNQVASLSAGGPTRFQGTITQPGTVTVNAQAASQATSTNFVANPSLSGGTNTVTVVATNGNGAAQTNHYQVVIPASSTLSPTYDADGNLTSNGNGQTYAWDAENRLITITYTGGATSNFAYDAFGRRVSIIEKNSGGTVTSTKQFVWCGSEMCEERDATGTTVTKRFYPQGEQIGTTNYYYTRDHLGSIREMTSSTGAIQARYDYDPYGRITPVGTILVASDFQYASYYEHAPSSLNLTWFRAYDPNTARWLSRDSAGEGWDATLYSYVSNDPIDLTDPLGLWGAGVAVAASAEIGTATGTGGGVTGSAGYGGFVGGPAGFNTGGFAGGGAFAGGGLAPPPTVTVPSRHNPGANQSPFASGAYAGFGGGAFLTNANSACELGKGFHQFNVNVGIGPVQFSLSVAYSGSTWIATLTTGPGFGASASGYPTYSATTPAPTSIPTPNSAPLEPLPRM
jgi:RHS repeat-associated protein